MSQLLFGNVLSIIDNDGSYCALRGLHYDCQAIGSVPASPERSRAHPWSVAGTFQNFRTKLASGATNGWTWKVRKNLADSGIITTFAGGNTDISDVTHSIAVVPGDILGIVRNHADSIRTWFALEFVPDDTALACYAWIGSNSGTINDYFAAPFAGQDANFSSFPEDMMARSGKIERLDVASSYQLTAGQTWTSTIYKNGVAQDGTGGTPNTTTVISNGQFQNNSTFSLYFVQGDVIKVKHHSAGGISASTAYLTGSIAVRYTDQLYQGIYYPGGADPANPTMYGVIATGALGGSWQTTEQNAAVVWGNPTTTFNVYGLAAYAKVAPGAGNGWRFTFRKNGADTKLITTIMGTAQFAKSNPYINKITSADYWSCKVEPIGTPAISDLYFMLSPGDTSTEPTFIDGIGGALSWIEMTS